MSELNNSFHDRASLSVSFFKLGGMVGRNFSRYELFYHDILWITEVAQFERDWPKSREGAGCTSVSYSAKVCRICYQKNNFIRIV